MEKRLVVLDSHALIHRSFYGVRDLTLKNGTPINAVYGFARVLMKIIEKMKPDYFVVAKDMPGKTFRHEEFKEYKATRTKAPQELYDQIPLVYKLVESFHIPIIGIEGFEADDIAGTLSKDKRITNDIKKYLITGDFDYLQLISPSTTIVHFKKGFTETKEYNFSNIEDYLGLRLDQVLDYKGLVGDPSDNLPGVRGVGEKTAKKLLTQFETIDGIYENIEQVKGKVKEYLESYKNEAYLSKKLSKIKCDIDLDFKLDDFKFNIKDAVLDIENIFNEFEFEMLKYQLNRLVSGNSNEIPKEEKKNSVKQESLF